MNIQEMQEAVDSAKVTIRRADSFVGIMAEMCRGRLRKVSPYILEDLKRELRDFNIRTGRWKD